MLNIGKEIGNDRFKKEQEHYIKHVVTKEISKSRIRSRYVPDMFATQNPQSGFPESTEPEPVIEQPIFLSAHSLFKSRIRR